MISYIFKNKTKNILAIVFTVLCMIKPLNNLWEHIIYYQTIDAYNILTLLPYALILIYMFTLKYSYKIKQFMFPVAFAVLIGLQGYSIMTTIFNTSYLINIYDTTYLDANKFLWFILSISTGAFAIVSRVFCFIGTLSNFKNVVFLRIGAIISIVLIAVITPITEFIMVGGVSYLDSIEDYYLKYLYVSMAETIIQRLIWMLFFVGVLLLTLNKKGEYIDITPYVEERKAKKGAKRAAKAEEKQREEARLNAPAPEIPDGCWRCMACGKILSDGENKCDCGYRK